MKTPIEYLTQIIHDCEELAKSPLTSSQTRNDLLETISSYREQIKTESFNMERTCAAISDIYDQANHALELQSKLVETYKSIPGHLEAAKQFVLETTGSFTYKRKGKTQITGIIKL